MVTQFKLPTGLGTLRRFDFPHKYGVLDRVYGRALAWHGISTLRTPGGYIWKLDLRNSSHRWSLYGSMFGPVAARWIRTHLANGGNVIDSGANIGQSLIEFAFCPGTRIYAFEPLPECCDWIKEGLGWNENMPVELVQCGLYKEKCQLEIQVAGDPEIHGAQSTLRLDRYSARDYKRLLIDLITLDEFAESRALDTIRFWKLDVEGAELEALMGAETLLKNQKIQALLVETDARKSGVLDFMAQFGYWPYYLNGRSHPVPWTAGSPDYWDYIFLPASE